jgi:putative DNA methylase
MHTPKKLIEVALPLEAINKASAREKSIRHGHPSTLHLWWARRPLAAARAVLFAQMVDDPSAWPELFPTEEAQQKEQERLFKIIEDLVVWENTTNEEVLRRAREELWKSWRRTCKVHSTDPEAHVLFNPEKLPAFHDPFAGGGSIPLEAQRLGLEAWASDLNPVAVLINKAMIEIPPRFAGKAPVNPQTRRDRELIARTWKGAQGLAEDVRYYGQWMREQAEQRIGHLYPKVRITEEMVTNRPDLKEYLGQELTVIAWLWARTVKSPNPAFSHIDVPLVSTFILSSKPGKEAYVEPVIENGTYRFTVRVGKPTDKEAAERGTKIAGSGTSFRCIISGIPITFEYCRNEAKNGRMGARLMAVVAEGSHGRVYLDPLPEHEALARSAQPTWKPDTYLPGKALGFRVQEYGMNKWADLFTPRQLVALTTFADLVGEAIEQCRRDALAAGLAEENLPLEEGGPGARAYAEAVGVYLAFVVDKCADYWSAICTWNVSREIMRNTFGRQAIPMVWDFAEGNPFCDATGNWMAMVEWTAKAVDFVSARTKSVAVHFDAQTQSISENKIISTDPPYYDNIGYADLSDFFYVWLRRSLKNVYPSLFATVAVPKDEELVATPYRHGNKKEAERFFMEGMKQALHRLAELAHPAFPLTIYYAFKQTEKEAEGGTASTGWETFLEAVIAAGFAITGTWPMRTELGNRMIGQDTNALASSIVLVCRRRPDTAKTVSRRDFINQLKAELPQALRNLQRGNIAPVDLAQAAIGPGMAIFTRYSQVLDAQGKAMTVREALSLINQVLDETIAEQEGDFDAESRWALAWFEQFGFAEAEFGVAETLSKAKDTSVEAMAKAGIVQASKGKVRLLRIDELPANWDPVKGTKRSVWETVHQLIRLLNTGGERATAKAVAALGSDGDVARELCYRLYTICERKKRSQEALEYNTLVQSWPEILRLATSERKEQSKPGELEF